MRHRVLWVALIAVLLTGGARPCAAGPSAFHEYEVKAAFLYNFAKFVTWSPSAFDRPDAPIVIGILGDDPFGPFLEKVIEDKVIGERSLEIRHLQSLDRIPRCHILFVSTSERRRLSEILVALRGLHVLTVSEMEPFARSGGIINFVVEENRVKFEVNVAAAEAADLKISSKLLRLAQLVGDIRPEETD